MTDANFITGGTTRWFQPPAELAAQDPDSRLHKRLAVLVGLVAVCLPIIMAGGSVLFDLCMRDSISHYYYDPFLGAVFVGLLIFIGGFLIAYTGEHWLEDTGSALAGIGACFVAVFPTIDSGCETSAKLSVRAFVEVNQGPPVQVAPPPGGEVFQLFANVGDVHIYGAAVLFAYLGLYCLFVLKRVVPARHLRNGRMIGTKKRRNTLYSVCGLTILGCVAVIWIKSLISVDGFLVWWDRWNLTFGFEALALWAFGIAWFAKGRRFASLNDRSGPT